MAYNIIWHKLSNNYIFSLLLQNRNRYIKSLYSLNWIGHRNFRHTTFHHVIQQYTDLLEENNQFSLLVMPKINKSFTQANIY